MKRFLTGLTLTEARLFRDAVTRWPGKIDEFIRELENEDDTLIDVVFLEDPNGSDVFAVFPGLSDSPGLVTCYSHNGHHSSAILRYCVDCAEVTDSSRYAQLAVELCRVGCEFRVARKHQIDWCSGCTHPGDDYEGPDCPGCTHPGECVDCEYQFLDPPDPLCPL